jgi:DNA processing protein
VAGDDDDFAAWFRLLETPGVGRETARKLLAACGSAAGVWHADPAALRALIGAAAEALRQAPPGHAARLNAARSWLDGDQDRHAITPDHPSFPPLLLQTADPPLLLYVQGRLDVLAAPAVAVVGSRRPTAQGLDHAREFSAALASGGWVIVSGLAQGIDAAAHEAALASGQATVAVMGTGPDRVYPSAHRELARRIAAQGAVVSEYPPGTPALPEHFPQRNRIIAGLTRGTLVVEAAPRSGSLITARLAAEAGREVFAIPGSIRSAQSQGCHALIQQGAKLVETVQDILDEFDRPGLTRMAARAAASGARANRAAEPAEGAEPDALLAALGDDPVTLDALLARTGESTATLNARLLELELEGRVARLPGGLFQRRHVA